MSKVTIIKNIISGEKITFCNDKSISFNLVTYILNQESKETYHLTNEMDRLRAFNNIECIRPKGGKELWYDQFLAVVAYKEGTY